MKEINKAIRDFLITNPIGSSNAENYSEVAHKFDVSREVVRGVWRRMKESDNSPNLNMKSTLENKIVEEITDKQVRTLDDLIKVCNIDTDIWEIKSYKCSTWDGSDKTGGKKYSVSAELVLKRFEPQEQDIISHVKKLISEEITPINDIVGINYGISNKALIVYLSDVHIGADSGENALYGNTYNASVARQRMDVVIKSIYDNQHLVDKLYLVDLGDAVDGYNNKTTRSSSNHTLKQNLSNRGQIDTFLSLYKYLVDSVAQIFNQQDITYVATTECNHGGDFGYVCNVALREYINARYPKITTFIGQQFINHIEIFDKVLVFSHGKDKEDMKFGWPLTVNKDIEPIIEEYIDYHKLHGKEIHVAKGDLHQSAITYGKKFRYVSVLSFYGGGKWQQTNFGRVKAGFEWDLFTDGSSKVVHGTVLFTPTSPELI